MGRAECLALNMLFLYMEKLLCPNTGYDNGSGWQRRVDDRVLERYKKPEAQAWKDTECCILKPPQILIDAKDLNEGHDCQESLLL